LKILFDLICGLVGGYVDKKYYKGIDELIEAYKYHLATDYWDLPHDLVLSKGKLYLDVFRNES